MYKALIFLLLIILSGCRNPNGLSVDLYGYQNQSIGKIRFTEKSDTVTFSADLFNLKPNENYSLKLHSGNCETISASFTLVTDITTDNSGKAEKTGLLLFREKELIKLKEIAAYDHIIVLSSDSVSYCNPFSNKTIVADIAGLSIEEVERIKHDA